jgi:chemotaxis protein MotB
MRVFLWIVAIVIVLALVGGGIYGKVRYDGFVVESTRQRARITELEEQAARANNERDQAHAARAELLRLVNATQTELEALHRQKAEAEKRLEAFKALEAKFQSMVDTGKIKIALRDGRMIVKLPAEVLFPSGSADLSATGQAALTEVAAILKDDPTRKLMVAGHTDNQPLGTSKYKNNWELSTARALTVTEFLIGAGLKPSNLVAAGYSEYDPIVPNRTAAGMQENRRIELVLLPPGLEDVPKLLGDAGTSPAAPASASAPAPAPASAPAPAPARP